MYLRLNLSNFGRGIFYWMYDVYIKRISKKLPVYDMEVVSIIRRMPRNAVCIDIGVNEAQMFNAMVNHCSHGEVYGFEPIPKLYNYLNAKFSSKAVHIYPYVLSDVEEEVVFYYFPKRSGVSGMSNRLPLLGKLTTEEICVKTVVLDRKFDLIRIDFIKIDVEGAELKVLRGLKQHLIKCRPTVVFECQHLGLDYFDITPEQIFDFFQQIGYSISLTKYFLNGMPALSRETLKELVKNRYEYQFVAWFE